VPDQDIRAEFFWGLYQSDLTVLCLQITFHITDVCPSSADRDPAPFRPAQGTSGIEPKLKIGHQELKASDPGHGSKVP
jgi:hypothetical protein